MMTILPYLPAVLSALGFLGVLWLRPRAHRVRRRR
jgi:hypothetical protein